MNPLAMEVKYSILHKTTINNEITKNKLEVTALALQFDNKIIKQR